MGNTLAYLNTPLRCFNNNPTLLSHLDFEISAALHSSPQHTPSQQEWDQERKQRQEEKEDKNDIFTPLGLERNQKMEKRDWRS